MDDLWVFGVLEGRGEGGEGEGTDLTDYVLVCETDDETVLGRIAVR